MAPLERRERAIITLAGVAPDFDGLGMVVDFATRHSATPTEWWGTYHHVLGHNLLFGAVLSAVGFGIGRKRLLTAALTFFSFHLHILGDIAGGRGPDGDQWPIHYLWPFSNDPALSWSGQWALNAWPNFAVTIALLGVTFYAAWRLGRSPLEFVSLRADAGLCATLRRRFGAPAGR